MSIPLLFTQAREMQALTPANIGNNEFATLPQFPNDATKFLRGDETFAAPAGGSGAVTQVKVTVTSAELLNLFTVPKTIVAAPGANKAILVLGMLVAYKFASAAYVNGGGGNFTFAIAPGTDDWAFTMVADNFVTKTSSQIQSFVQTSSWFGPITDADNQALILKKETANLTAGDGTLEITVVYATIDLT